MISESSWIEQESNPIKISKFEKKEEIKMPTLSEFAKTYSPETTKNISDLKEVSTSLTLEDREGKDKNGNKFRYKVIVVDGEDYRVPSSVIGNLKAILEKKPTMTKFSVARQGKTKDDTKYTVIPLD